MSETLNEPVVVTFAVVKFPAVVFPVIMAILSTSRLPVCVVPETFTLMFAVTLFVVIFLDVCKFPSIIELFAT